MWLPETSAERWFVMYCYVVNVWAPTARFWVAELRELNFVIPIISRLDTTSRRPGS